MKQTIILLIITIIGLTQAVEVVELPFPMPIK